MFITKVTLQFTVLLLIRVAFGDPSERRLYKDLLQDYHILERPVENNLEPVNVDFSVLLQHIIDVDEQKQTIQVNAWLQYGWKDYKLKWDPDKYGGIKDIRLPYDKCWKPDVLLYNSVDVNFGSIYPANLIVHYTGVVLWIPPGILKSTCHIDIRYFPFDEQQCMFKFGSWTYDGYKLNLTLGNFDVSGYVVNGEWTLESATAKRHLMEYACCPEPYIDLQFLLTLRRRSLYYVFNLIIPSIIISFMSLLGFVLPVESNQKITLEVVLLLSLCIFSSAVAQITPPTSIALPLVGIFFIVNMMAVSASLIMNVLITNIYYKESKKPPIWFRQLFIEIIPKILFMDSFDQRRSDFQENGSETLDELSKLLPPSFISNPTPMETSLYPTLNKADTQNPSSVYQAPAVSYEPTLNKIYSLLHQLRMRTETRDHREYAKRFWKYVANVLDRICFIFFILFLFIATVATIFCRP